MSIENKEQLKSAMKGIVSDFVIKNKIILSIVIASVLVWLMFGSEIQMYTNDLSNDKIRHIKNDRSSGYYHANGKKGSFKNGVRVGLWVTTHNNGGFYVIKDEKRFLDLNILDSKYNVCKIKKGGGWKKAPLDKCWTKDEYIEITNTLSR